jgi:AbrB family looped-hinge helix DNA binding protein
MANNSRILKCDSKGQVVIPKEIRDALNITVGTGFFVYQLSNNEILLKRIDEPTLDKNSIRNKIRRKV